MLNLKEFLAQSDFDFIHVALEYALSSYDCGNERALASLESVKAMTEQPPDPFEVSAYDLYCTINIVQVYLKDMDELGSKEDVREAGNGVLKRLAAAGTRGTDFTVNNSPEPLE